MSPSPTAKLSVGQKPSVEFDVSGHHGPVGVENLFGVQTQTFAASTGTMCSLQDFLEGSSAEVGPLLPGVVTDVRQQLRQLGTGSDTQHRVADLVWPHHDGERLRSVWVENEGPTIAPDVDPGALVDQLRADHSLVWVEVRPCNHGDLNPTNVAVEVSPSGAKAYIFDAGGVQKDAACRDLAYLEVTSLLHRQGQLPRDLVQWCAQFYGEDPRPEDVDAPDVARSIRCLVECIRDATRDCDARVYALLVLDAALLQLGGLAFGRNKIANPSEAVQLVALSAAWYLAQGGD